MKCDYCGAEVPAGKSFCMWCGTRQAEEKAVPETEVVEAAYTQLPVTDPLEEEFPEILPVAAAAATAATAAAAVTAAESIPVKVPEKTAGRPRRIPPRLQLPAERGLGKMFFLGILTLGIYPVVIWSRIVTELNIAASRYDGKRTMPYFAMVTLSPITLGIYSLVWMHKFCHRISDELVRRNSDYKFGPSTFWLWGVLGSLIIVGPFVFIHRLMQSMNRINTHYNVYG